VQKNGQESSDQNDSFGSQVEMTLPETGVKHEEVSVSMDSDDGWEALPKQSDSNTIQNTMTNTNKISEIPNLVTDELNS